MKAHKNKVALSHIFLHYLGLYVEVQDMSHPTLSSQEVARRGKELYQKSIRAKVETQENIGKIISINVETGDYEIGDDLVETSLRLRSK